MPTPIDAFSREVCCEYKDESYLVRDNGAVLRRSRDHGRKRSADDTWTFGTPNLKTGNLEIVGERVHRIVAMAFHGNPPTKEHVVDHIDTNKHNNRPENLRWVTRLENAILNPITLKRIEFACGCTIDEFLSNPAAYRNRFAEPNFGWMRTVSLQEAQASKERLLAWAASDHQPSGGSLGEWVFRRGSRPQIERAPIEFIPSLTANALQRDWKIPTEFPCCPNEISHQPIADYAAKMRINSVFSTNRFSTVKVEDFAISKDQQTLWVLGRNDEPSTVKPLSLAEVTFLNHSFIHKSLGTFFNKDGAEKQFTLAQGLIWTGGDTFDELV